MISQNDLYDIGFVFVLFRDNIKCELNSVIIDKIEYVLMSKKKFEDNQIRKAISSIPNLNYEKWRYMYYNNIYVNRRLLMDESIYRLLIELCDKLKQLLIEQHFEQAYDFVDSIHCLPNIIADNNFKIPKKFWNVHMKLYSSKWDKGYMKKDFKLL